MSARSRRSRLGVTPLETRVNPSTFTWDGGGADDNWSTGANWVGDVAPTAADVDTVVVFNTVDPNVVMDIAGMDVARIQFDAGSDVTLVLNTDLTLDAAGAAVNIQDTTASTNVIAGPGGLVLTNADAVINHPGFPGFLLVSAPITGLRGFTKTGTGTIILSTTVGNTYRGTTTVADGVLELRTDTLNRGLSGNVVVGDGVGAAGTAVLQFGPTNNFELRSDTTLTVNGDGRVNVPGGAIDSLTSLNVDGGRLNLAGTFHLQSGGIVSSNGAAGSVIDAPGELASLGVLFRFDVADGPGATDLLVSTSLSQVDFPATLVKTGTGTIEFAMPAANTLTGATLVRDGVLLLNTTTTDAALSGAITVGDAIGAARSAALRLVNASEIADTAGIRVNADGLLDVTATASEKVASLNLNLAPGGGGFAIATGGVFQVEPADPLDTIDLTGGVLTFNRTGPLVPMGQTVTLIDNLGADPVTGTFAGLPEGGVLTANGQTFTISYVGGDGNDVVLTPANTPPSRSRTR
ncbi:autotransporter-associated beta strand repeat-containing protein [Urbifossiella limnaea]|uniref:Autotransporter-associated beta strand repeat protein n=1 Tax=Urbifossiella limnaea TaxID=2528023 RepID=A0A517XQ49_9BACT|nr:autotransporter-associated beta strand repeat-containing protein [Urbifossiella limnaea]QDU19645.1 Autotransporter-associated beta strand repeat protein [Urbifossiella limnaea]